MSPRGQSAMGFGVPPFTRGVKWLGIVTLAVSIAASVLGEAGQTLAARLVFIPGGLLQGHVWTPLTYTFLNLDPIGLLFALLGLWLLGASLEQRWGTRRFVTFYFLTGAAGALATALVAIVSPAVRAHPYYGNWSSLEGLIAAFAVLLPDAQIFLYFIPVPARWMLPSPNLISGAATSTLTTADGFGVTSSLPSMLRTIARYMSGVITSMTRLLTARSRSWPACWATIASQSLGADRR